MEYPNPREIEEPKGIPTIHNVQAVLVTKVQEDNTDFITLT